MLTELSLHILDIAENSVRAGATFIEITVAVDTKKECIAVIIKDNGCGMSTEKVKRVLDPFFTTRTTRKVGLGIPFFKMAAKSTGGSFLITSKEGEGTTVEAHFISSHIDCIPLGDMDATMHTLVIFHEEIRFLYKYMYDKKEFELDTKAIREILGDISFKEKEVSDFIKSFLKSNRETVNGDGIT